MDFAKNTYYEHKPYKNAILSSVCDVISKLTDNNKRIGRVLFSLSLFVYI